VIASRRTRLVVCWDAMWLTPVIDCGLSLHEYHTDAIQSARSGISSDDQG